MNMLELAERASRKYMVENNICAVSTKQEFGDYMHDDSISDEEKIEVARQVAELGGYECLQ